MHDAGGLGRVEHPARFVGVAGERLLAQHVLARRDRLERDRRVRVRRCGDRDRVDSGERERVGEVREAVRDVEALGAFGGLLGVAPDERVHVEAGGAERAQVRDAAEAGAHDHDAGHAPPPGLSDEGPDLRVRPMAKIEEAERDTGVGTKVVFENDQVRVWVLAPRARRAQRVHQHDLDHLLIQISGDRIAVEPEPDAEGPHRDYMEAPVIPGMVAHVPKGGIETAVNVGAEPYYEIIVELKRDDSEAAAG